MPSEKARIEEAGGEVINRSGTHRLGMSREPRSTHGPGQTIGTPKADANPRTGSLNMSRAVGDLQYKNPVNTLAEQSVQSESRGNFLSNDPYTSRRTLHTDRRYLLLVVSDGVTDRVDDANLVKHVMKLSMRGKPASEIAQEIATNSASRPQSDNASCIVAMIDGRES